MKKFFTRYHQLLLVLILAFAFVTRIYQLYVPQRYVFDEVYHAVTAKLIRRNDPWAYEWWNPPIEPDTAVDWLHPPLAKYTQAISMEIFGENSFGWRFSSVVFGVLVILATYKLALVLFKDKNLALLSALLASLDGLLLVQSRVAMNDIHVTFFILLAFISGLKYLRAKALFIKKLKTPELKLAVFWSLATGLSVGLAMGSKWSGMFAFAYIWICEVLTWLWFWLKLKKWHPKHLKLLFINMAVLGVMPFLIYVLCYIHMFTLGHSLFCHEQRQIEKQCYHETIKLGNQVIFDGYLSHFMELHRQIWLYQTNLAATHPYQSRPWQWFLDARPVWYHVEYFNDGRIANIYAFGNPLLFWLGDLAVIASLVFLIRTIIKKHQLSLPSLLYLIGAYFIVWLPWTRSPRIMFFYHYTPAVPLLAINLAYWLQYLFTNKNHPEVCRKLAVIAVGLIAVIFILWYPLWTGIPVATKWANSVYFLIPTWK